MLYLIQVQVHSAPYVSVPICSYMYSSIYFAVIGCGGTVNAAVTCSRDGTNNYGFCMAKSCMVECYFP